MIGKLLLSCLPYSGNAGPTVTTRYLASFLLILRQSKNVVSKLKIYGLQKTLADLYKKVTKDPGNPMFSEQANELLQLQTNWQPHTCAKFAEILLLMKDAGTMRRLFLSPLMSHEYWSSNLNADMLEFMDVFKFR